MSSYAKALLAVLIVVVLAGGPQGHLMPRDRARPEPGRETPRSDEPQVLPRVSASADIRESVVDPLTGFLTAIGEGLLSGVANIGDAMRTGFADARHSVDIAYSRYQVRRQIPGDWISRPAGNGQGIVFEKPAGHGLSDVVTFQRGTPGHPVAVLRKPFTLRTVDGRYVDERGRSTDRDGRRYTRGDAAVYVDAKRFDLTAPAAN